MVYVLIILDNATIALTPLLLGWFINSLQTGNTEALRNSCWYVGGYLVLKIVYWIFHAPARVLEQKIAFHICNNFLKALYHQALHFRLKWHQDRHSGATISRIQKSSGALSEFLQNNSVCTTELAKFFFAMIAMIIYSPIFGSIAFLLGVFTVWVIVKLDKPYIAAIHEMNEGAHKVNSVLFDSLSNIVTVITLRLQKRMEFNLNNKLADIFPAVFRQIKLYELKWGISDILIAIIYAVVVVGYVMQNQQPGKPFPLGDFVALLGFVTQFTSVFQSMASYYTAIVKYSTDVQSSEEILNTYKEQSPVNEHPAFVNWKHIAFKGLNFRHDEASAPHSDAQSIKDISIAIEKGKRVALIGESGSGKSTLMAVLRGLYDAEPGVSVMVDGHQSELVSVGQAVTLFPQEPEIFESTIEHNITLGLPTENSSIIEACEIAHFMEVVNRLPNGLQSVISEKGVNLSGGERQRLALVRGILAAEGSDIILMDEPTSSLDAKTERNVLEKILTRCKHKAIVATLHRLYLLKYFDYIYILDRGRIVDEGTYEDLCLRSDHFIGLMKHAEVQLEQ